MFYLCADKLGIKAFKMFTGYIILIYEAGVEEAPQEFSNSENVRIRNFLQQNISDFQE